MGLFNRIKQDITHPFGIGNPQPQQPQPVRTPAPMQQAPRPIASTAPRPMQAPQPSFQMPHFNMPNPLHAVGNFVHNDIAAPVQRDIVQPTSHAIGNTVNAFSAHSLNNHVLQPVLHVPQQVDQYATQHALGRGLQTVGLGALQIGVEGVQGVAGLGDAMNHRLGLYQGASPFTQGVTNLAKNIDATAKAEHSNQALYRGTQVAGNIAGFALGGGVGDLAKAVPVAGRVVQGAEAGNNLIKSALAARTAGLAEKGLAGRVAAKTIQNIANPTYQAGNAAFTALQSGQQIANGRKVTPGSVATNLAIGGLGFPAAGAVAHEATAPVINKGVQALRDTHLIRPTNLTDQELTAASKVMNANSGGGVSSMDLTSNDMAHFHNAQLKLGAKPGTPEGIKAVNDALLQHQAYDSKVLQRKQALEAIKQQINEANSNLVNNQGGYVKNPLAGKQEAQKPGKAMSIEQPKTEDQPVVTQNRLTKGAKEGRQNLSPEAQKLVQGEGTVRNTKQLADEAKAKADSQSLDKTIQTAHESLAVEPGKIDDATVAHVQQAIERADAAGRTHDAVALHDSLSEHLRKQGQTIQAASLLYRLSPQGLLYKGMRDIKQSGTEVTPELETKLRDATDAIKQAADPEAKMLAQATFHKLVADNLKKTTANKLLSVWKAGLLSGPLTHAGNFASNETFNALKTASNPVSAGVDKLISLKTGQRTKVATMRGVGSGTKQGMGQSLQTLKTGIDPRNIEGSKYEIHGELNFKNPIVQKVFGNTSNGVFRMMSAGDQPVYYRNLKQNLYDLGLADGKNKGLKGQQLVEHAEKLVANPTKQIAETAKLAAQKAVLSQDSKIASSISRIAQEHPALQAVIPFVKVPTNFLVRTMDFSPVGLGKAGLKLYQDAKAGRPFDQRALSEAIGEGLTGTALIAIGTHLANNNLLSGQYPSSDRKEAQRWKAEGIQPNSVKIGGKWINLNYLGPIGLLLGAGKDYHTAAVTGDNGAMQALAGFGKSLAGQSFLTGFSGAANAINDPGRYGSNFVHSQAASVVPSWLNAIGNATDSKQRQASSTLESVQSRLPGLRKGLPVKQDAYGNALPQRTGPVDMTIDPLKPSNDLSKKNQVVSEVSRLHNVDPNNSDLQVTPVPPTSLKVDGQAIKLNARQKYDLQTKTGQQIQQTWDKIIKTPEYKAMSDTDKAKTLSNARQDASTLATRQYVVDNKLGTYKKAASSSVAALAGGDVSRYLNGSTGSGTPIATTLPKPQKDFLTKYNAMSTDQRTKATNTQNDFEYNYLVAKYANDKANNKLSTVQDIKAKEAIDKALVGKDFSKQVRDLHGLNKGELYTYLTTPEKGVDKQKLANDIIKYDDALTQHGIQAKNKFRLKNGVVAIQPSAKKAKGSGRGRKGTGSGSRSVASSALNVDYSGTSKLTNAALAGIKASNSSRPKVTGRHIALKTYNPNKATIKKPKLLRSMA